MRENRNFRAAQDVLSERLRAIVCAVKESVENRESRWARSFVGRPCVEGERTNREAEDGVARSLICRIILLRRTIFDHLRQLLR